MEPILHRDYCPRCRKPVEPKVEAALPETVWMNRPENVIETESLLTNFSTELSQTY